MEIEKKIFMAVFFLCIVSGLIALIIIAVLGRTKMKEVDKYLHGSTFQHDSIFFQLLRFSQYSYFFISHWVAKRGGYLELYEHFDDKFKRPFRLAFLFNTLTVFFIVVLAILDKYYLL